MIKVTGRNILLNAVGGFLTAYGWVAFLCFFYLQWQWASAAPRSPDPAHGLVFPHKEHGTIAYFSAFQATSCALLFATSIPLSFLGMFMSPRRNVVSRRARLAFWAKWDRDDPHGVAPWAMRLGVIAAPLFVFFAAPPLVTWLNAQGIAVGF